VVEAAAEVAVVARLRRRNRRRSRRNPSDTSACRYTRSYTETTSDPPSSSGRRSLDDPSGTRPAFREPAPVRRSRQTLEEEARGVSSATSFPLNERERDEREHAGDPIRASARGPDIAAPIGRPFAAAFADALEVAPADTDRRAGARAVRSARHAVGAAVRVAVRAARAIAAIDGRARRTRGRVAIGDVRAAAVTTKRIARVAAVIAAVRLRRIARRRRTAAARRARCVRAAALARAAVRVARAPRAAARVAVVVATADVGARAVVIGVASEREARREQHQKPRDQRDKSPPLRTQPHPSGLSRHGRSRQCSGVQRSVVFRARRTFSVQARVIDHGGARRRYAWRNATIAPLKVFATLSE
jgi:hypothetical protein